MGINEKFPIRPTQNENLFNSDVITTGQNYQWNKD